MKLQIAIVEDDERERESALRSLEESKEWLGENPSVTAYKSAEEFLFEHGESNVYDILLLDVEMGSISGIELARRIRKNDSRAEIIFITSHFELMGEGYEVEARHYLVKPVKREKLLEVISRAVSHLSEESPAIMIKCDGESVKIVSDRILYVESLLHYLSIHTADGDYTVKESISSFEQRLGNGFFRTHRSYIVSLSHIVRISRSDVTLDDGTVLPLSRGLYDKINRAFVENN